MGQTAVYEKVLCSCQKPIATVLCIMDVYNAVITHVCWLVCQFPFMQRPVNTALFIYYSVIMILSCDVVVWLTVSCPSADDVCALPTMMVVTRYVALSSITSYLIKFPTHPRTQLKFCRLSTESSLPFVAIYISTASTSACLCCCVASSSLCASMAFN